MNQDRQRLEERRDLALQDLLELEQQVEGGEIADQRADQLRARYEAEAVSALAALERLDDPVAARPSATERRRRFSGPVAAIVTTVAVAAGALILLPGALSDRPDGGFVTGNEATAGRDLDDVTDAEMEVVVAENPDVVPMRLRLAHRYLDQGEFERAFDHYRAVLDRQAEPEALSHLGWVVFNQGEPELALQLIEASLNRQPDEPEALWFLANVRLLGTEDPQGAMDALDRLAARDDLRGDDRAAVEDLRAAAAAQLDDREES